MLDPFAGAMVDRAIESAGQQPDPLELAPGGHYCWDCKRDIDNHYPCGVAGCRCYCNDPETPPAMKRPPERHGSTW